MGLQQIVYISSTSHDFSEGELRDMLSDFRANNSALNVTGILLYKKNRFMQLLEGEKGTIESLMANIKLDPRHQDVLEIYNNATSERYFANWSMSFYNLSKIAPTEIPGYNDYLETELDNGIFKNCGETFKFLRIFKLSSVSM